MMYFSWSLFDNSRRNMEKQFLKIEMTDATEFEESILIRYSFNFESLFFNYHVECCE